MGKTMSWFRAFVMAALLASCAHADKVPSPYDFCSDFCNERQMDVVSACGGKDSDDMESCTCKDRKPVI